MDAFECIRTMRAVRQFSETRVPDEVLTRILQAGRWSGSAKNSQPWHLIVVRDRDSLARLSECGQFAGHLRGAALGIAIVVEPVATRGEFDSGRLSQNMQLAAWADGVGSCIAAMYEEEKAKAILGVPAPMSMIYVISFGYPLTQERPQRLPALSGRGRKKLDDIVHWEKW